MARTYEKSLHDLPRVGVPDWEMFEQLEELVNPYVPLMTGPPASIFFARDSRGHYDASSLEDLRAQAEAQEQLPHTIRLTVSTFTELVNVYASSQIGSGGTVRSHDEAFVNHMATRIRELFEQAAQRLEPAPQETFEEASQRVAEEYALEQAEQPRNVNVVTGVYPPIPQPSFWQKHGERIEKWALVIVPVLLGVLLTAWLIGK